MEQINRFLIYISAIALVYVGQTCFKIKQTRKNGTFNWNELWGGLLDHLLYFFGAFCVLCSGLLLPEMKVTILGGMELGTTDVLFALSMALYIKQTTSAFNNIRENYELENVEVMEEVPYEENFQGGTTSR